MSDYDRNVAARGFGAARSTAIDVGLRAYMIRIYNYMAAGVALTGVVAWMTFNAAVVTDAAGKITGLTSFGQTIFSGPLTIVLFLGTLGHRVLPELPYQRLQASTALALFIVLCRLARADAVDGASCLHRRLGDPHLLHLGCIVRRAEPVWLHHAARSFADRIVPGDGSVRAHHWR